MRKTVLLTFLACSIILVTCGSVNCANAKVSPYEQYFFPSEPYYSPPSIVIHTPIKNETHNVTDPDAILNLTLNFTITKPDRFRGNIVSVWYTLDDIERFYIDIQDEDSMYNTNLVLKHTLQLRLGCGVYCLKIGLEAKSYYLGLDDKQEFAHKSVNVSAVSEPITFTINPPPTPAPTQTPLSQTENQHTLNPIDYLLPIIALAIVIIALVLLYRRHKKQLTQNNRALPS